MLNNQKEFLDIDELLKQTATADNAAIPFEDIGASLFIKAGQMAQEPTPFSRDTLKRQKSKAAIRRLTVAASAAAALLALFLGARTLWNINAPGQLYLQDSTKNTDAEQAQASTGVAGGAPQEIPRPEAAPAAPYIEPQLDRGLDVADSSSTEESGQTLYTGEEQKAADAVLLALYGLDSRTAADTAESIVVDSVVKEENASYRVLPLQSDDGSESEKSEGTLYVVTVAKNGNPERYVVDASSMLVLGKIVE